MQTTSTCIVGLIENGIIYMGADSAGVSYPDIRIRKDRKLFRKDNLLIGFTTSFRMGQILRYSFIPPKYDFCIDPFEYISTLFTDLVRDSLKKGGFASKDKEVETGGCFLVGFEKRLFCIHNDYQVSEYLEENYDAVGCGENYALGSLYSTKGKDPMERIKIALEAAGHFSAAIRGPFIFETLP